MSGEACNDAWGAFTRVVESIELCIRGNLPRSLHGIVTFFAESRMSSTAPHPQKDSPIV